MLSRRSSLVILAVLVAVVAGLGTVAAKGRRPKPEKHFASKDIRLHIPKPKDLTGWKQKTKFDAQKESSVMYTIIRKLPDSPDVFDVRIFAQGWDQQGTLTIKGHDGTEHKVGIGSVGRIAEIFSENVKASFKEVKEMKKLKKTRISPTIKKGYVFTITGRSWMPLHHRVYAFGVNGKTYVMEVLMTTTSIRDTKLVKTVDTMIKKMIAWKP